jgi:hypothetical protein
MFGSALPPEWTVGASAFVNALKTVVFPDLGNPRSPIFIAPTLLAKANKKLGHASPSK